MTQPTDAPDPAAEAAAVPDRCGGRLVMYTSFAMLILLLLGMPFSNALSDTVRYIILGVLGVIYVTVFITGLLLDFGPRSRQAVRHEGFQPAAVRQTPTPIYPNNPPQPPRSVKDTGDKLIMS